MVGEHTRSLEVIIAVSIEIMGVIYLVKKHLTFFYIFYVMDAKWFLSMDVILNS